MKLKAGTIITLFLEGYNELSEAQYRLRHNYDVQKLANRVACLRSDLPFNALQYKLAKYLTDMGVVEEIALRSPIVPLVEEHLIVAEPVYKESLA